MNENMYQNLEYHDKFQLDFNIDHVSEYRKWYKNKFKDMTIEDFLKYKLNHDGCCYMNELEEFKDIILNSKLTHTDLINLNIYYQKIKNEI